MNSINHGGAVSNINERAGDLSAADCPSEVVCVDALPIRFNVVACRIDTEPQEEEATWAEFREGMLSKPVEFRDEKDGSGWMPVMLKDQKVGRRLDNVDKVSCLVLDVDHGMSFDEAVRVLRAHGYEAAMHTSFSHSEREHRYRIVFPLAEPVVPAQAESLFAMMQKIFDGKLDPACMEASRLFYLPACPKEASALFRFEHIEGRALCVEDAAGYSIAIAFGGAPSAPSKIPTSTGSASSARGGLSKAMGTVPVGERNTRLAQLVGQCIAKGVPIDKTKQLAAHWNATRLADPLPPSEIERTIQSVYKTAQRKAALAAVDVSDALEEMNKKYVFLTEPAVTIDLETCTKQTPEMMRQRYSNAKVHIHDNGRVKEVSHYEIWTKATERREHLGLTFEPGAGLIVNDRVNTWRHWAVEPRPGDIKPWNDLLDHLFGAGTENRRWIEQWIAYPIQHPGSKLSTAVILWSAVQGVGKSLLGETVSAIYGEHGKTITAVELHDKYNSWADRTLFVLGEENTSSDRRADGDRLKDLITGDTLYIERKYHERTQQRNMMNFMFTSNHPDAFHLEIHDRRFGVFAFDGKPLDPSFYKEFVNWRRSPSGLSALMNHMLHVDLTGFDSKGHAPITSAKLDMIEQSKTETERWVTDMLSDEYVRDHIGAEIVSINDLVALYKRDGGLGVMNPTAMGKAIRRQTTYCSRRISFDGARPTVISLRRHDYWEGQDAAAWSTEFAKARRHMMARSIAVAA